MFKFYKSFVIAPYSSFVYELWFVPLWFGLVTETFVIPLGLQFIL